MIAFLKEARRLVNRLIGTGPYGLIPFQRVVDATHDESTYGVDYPESTTGILYQGNTQWVEYSRPTLSLTEKITSRMVDNQPRYLEKGIFPEPSRIVYSLSKGGIASSSGLVYDTKTRLAIKETVRNWTSPPKYQPVLLAPKLPPPVYLEGVTLSLITLGAEGFYHFFHESLPKLFLSKFLLESIDHVLVNGCGEDWKILWLKRAGIPIEKVVWIGGLSHYRCEQLLFVSEVVANEQPNLWSVAALRSLLDAPASLSGDRWIWASRADAASRRLTWEDEILEHFPKFERICFSSLSPEETISICSRCKVFAGPHGAAFSNIIFCNPGTLVMEFSPNQFKNPSFTRLADVCNLRHATAVVNFESLPSNFAGLQESIAALLSTINAVDKVSGCIKVES